MLGKVTLLIMAVGVSFAARAHVSAEGDGVQGGANPFSFSASYVGDAYYNAVGGIKRGGGFMGMGNIRVGFDTGRAGWWRGGELMVNGASIHGKSLTENYLGDMQVASNIDGGEHAYLHELWFRQRLGRRVTMTLGLQDLNADFMVSEGGGEFINSSFGVPPVISTGIPVPIFPLTGLGAAVKWDVNDSWAVQAALFDGCQTDFDENPHNLCWKLCREDGALAMAEAHYLGRFKLGAYYHTRLRNYGVYAMVDQPLSPKFALFGQYTLAPRNRNINNYSLALGANFAAAESHSLGAAVTHAGLHQSGHRHETAVEIYYKYTLSDNIALQPDVQWVVNPSGGEAKLPNALVGMLRLHVNF